MQLIIMNNDETIDQLAEERATLRTKLEDLTQQVENVGYNDERFLNNLQDEVEKYKQAIRESESDAADKNSLIQRLKAEVANLEDELRGYNVDVINKQMSEKDEIIQGLQSKLEEAYRDFELLSLDWDKIDQALKSKSEIDVNALRAQLETTNKMKEKIEAYKSRHKRNVQKLKAVDTQIEEKEKEIVELRERIDKYEKGVYGLQDAVREIKELKLRLNIRDKEILDRTQHANDLEKQMGELYDENDELRRRLGVEDRSAIDISSIRNSRSVELEQARALNTQLQSEIDRLEEERLQMKAAMRLHALEKGERAVQLGMTAEDLAEVEDYAERLRVKRGGLSSKKGVATTIINSEQLEKLAVELERAHVDASEAREETKKLEVGCLSKIIHLHNPLKLVLAAVV